MKNISDLFIDRLFEFGKSQLSDKVLDHAKRSLLDYFGATFVGVKLINDLDLGLYDEFVDPGGRYTVIGTTQRASLEQATFLNGFASHIAEMDDGVRFGMLHPGTPIISALLSIAQKEGVKKSDLLTGIVTGYECAIRLSMAIQPTHYARGYHPTATCGTVGAAVGIAAMLKFPKSRMKHAFSAALGAAFGSLKAIEDESQLKPFNVARAALNGLLAARLAKTGLLGPRCPLSGNSGFFKMTSDNWDERKLIENFAVEAAIELTYIKPYAACRHAHPAIEAAIKIKKDFNMDLDKIRRVKVITYESVLGKHDHREIYGVSSAKMSIPFSVAVSLVRGKAGIHDFTISSLNDSEIIALTNLVTVVGDRVITSRVPEMRSAIVEVEMHDGILMREQVDFPKGEPESPLTNSELDEKIFDLLSFAGIEEKYGRKLSASVWSSDEELEPLFVSYN